MTDKDEIKFAIRYLKQGLKSKRTPPLHEELMKELGFEKKDKVTQGLESVLENVVRNKRQLTKAKELLNEFMRISKASDEDFEHDYSELIGETEQFLNSEVEK